MNSNFINHTFRCVSLYLGRANAVAAHMNSTRNWSMTLLCMLCDFDRHTQMMKCIAHTNEPKDRMPHATRAAKIIWNILLLQTTQARYFGIQFANAHVFRARDNTLNGNGIILCCELNQRKQTNKQITEKCVESSKY